MKPTGTILSLYFLAVLAISLSKQPDSTGPARVIAAGPTLGSDVPQDADEDDPINWSVKKTVKKTKDNVNTIIKFLLPTILKASEGISPECVKSLMHFSIGMKQMKDWAGKMFDATAKLPSGVLMGTTLALGSYDECVDVIVANEKKPTEEIFRGQYCLLDLRSPKSLLAPEDVVANATGIKNFNSTFFKVFPEKRGFGKRFKLTTALCVPSTCTEDDVLQVSSQAIRQIGFSASILSCDVKSEPQINNNQLAAICVLAPFLVLIALGTLVDAIYSLAVDPKLQHEKSLWRNVVSTFRIFSLYSNTKKFLEAPKNDGKLNALTGMRFFSITWIILGHSYYFPDDLHFAKMKDMFTITETQYDVPFMVIQNTALGVDTFFVVTAFLTVYSSWRRMENHKGRLPWTTFFMKRIMRLLPAQFLVIGILVLLPLMGDGPLWKNTWKIPVENCEKYWWTNILSVQNFWGLEDMCLFHTWFLAVSMQLHLMTFFLILLLYRKPVLGVLVNVILIVGGTVAVSLVTLYKEYPPTFDTDVRAFPMFHKFYNNVYTLIYSHFGSYCSGMILGYYVSRYPRKSIQLPAFRAISWVLMTAVGLATVFGLYAFIGYAWSGPNPLAHVAYAGIHRTTWGLCVAWVIYDCVMYPKGIVNRFLSWPAFIYLDRLTFMAYLLHPLVMYYHQARLREVINSDYFDMVYYFLGTTCLTYIVSFLIHVALEQPVNSMDSLIFGSKTRHAASKTKDTTDSTPTTAETAEP